MADTLDPALRVIIESAYDRSTSPPGQPTSWNIFYFEDPIKLTKDFIAAIPTGLDNGLEDLFGVRPFKTTRPGPYGVGGTGVTYTDSETSDSSTASSTATDSTSATSSAAAESTSGVSSSSSSASADSSSSTTTSASGVGHAKPRASSTSSKTATAAQSTSTSSSSGSTKSTHSGGGLVEAREGQLGRPALRGSPSPGQGGLRLSPPVCGKVTDGTDVPFSVFNVPVA